MKATLTTDQKREIIRLRSMKRQWKVIARIVECSPEQARHVWRFATKAGYPEKNRRTSKESRTRRLLAAAASYRITREKIAKAEQQTIAKQALREEIEAAKSERSTAPIFRIRPDEWSVSA